MSKTKKQHYVPQFYLRRFADSGQRFYVFDKSQQKSYGANIKDVAGDSYFYDLSQDAINTLKEGAEKARAKDGANQSVIDQSLQMLRETQIIETYLNPIETRSRLVLDKVLEGLEHRRRFKKEYRDDLATIMSFQFWRTMERRQQMLELESKAEEEVMKIVQRIDEVKGTKTTAEDLCIAFDATNTADRHKMNLINEELIEKTSQIFLGHIWHIGINQTTQPFYTSDNPVATSAHKTDDWRSNSGIASSGIEIAFPLSPEYILILHERTYWANVAHLDNRVTYLKPDNVTYFNCLQVYSSNRQVYSFTNNFDLADKMCREQSEFTDPKRPRWT